MEQKHGVKGNSVDGVFFSESAIGAGAPVGRVAVEISRQNADLSQVKQRMAAKAAQMGADAIENFRYGQRKHPWWKLFFLKWDTESWYGEGDGRRT